MCFFFVLAGKCDFSVLVEKCGFTGLTEKCVFMEMCVLSFFLRKNASCDLGRKVCFSVFAKNAFFGYIRKCICKKVEFRV